MGDEVMFDRIRGPLPGPDDRRQLAEIRDSSITTLIARDPTGAWAGFAQVRAGKISDGVPATADASCWKSSVPKRTSRNSMPSTNA